MAVYGRMTFCEGGLELLPYALLPQLWPFPDGYLVRTVAGPAMMVFENPQESYQSDADRSREHTFESPPLPGHRAFHSRTRAPYSPMAFVPILIATNHPLTGADRDVHQPPLALYHPDPVQSAPFLIFTDSTS
jgi:hypothetical protein